MIINRSGGVVFVCFFVLAIVAGKLCLRSNPTAWTELVPESWLSKEDKKAVNESKPTSWTDLLPDSWLSKEDKKALNDPKAASKSFDQLGGESWQRYKEQQPQGGWSQGWKK